MNIWVQKSRLKLKRGGRGSHCTDYLDPSNPTERFLSGGRNSTANPRSMAYIRQIQAGDLIVLFQVDDKSFYALSQADSAGMEADKGSGHYDSFYLKPTNDAFRFGHPLTLAKLRATGCNPECFGPHTNGRIFPLSMDDFVALVKAVTKANPDQSKTLAAWLRERS